MIGLGGWGGRTEKDGPYVYVNDKGDVVRDETPGSGGNHGAQWEFPVIVRAVINVPSTLLTEMQAAVRLLD
jgi:hypothetical protein